MLKKILVTGAGGYLGQQLIAVLQTDFEVRGLDVTAPPGAGDFVVGSVTDPVTIGKSLEGIDALVIAHMFPNRPGSYDSVGQPFDVNVKGTALLLEKAVQSKIRRVVLISSVGVVERHRLSGAYLSVEMPYAPKGIYSLTKVLQEEVARYFHHEHGLEVAMLRPAYVITEDPLEDKYGRKPPTVNWQFIDPRDIASAAAAALRMPGLTCEAFFLVGGPDAEAHTDIELTRQRLGWKARHDFSRYPRDA